METFLEFLREILKGVVRELCAYFIRKNVLENKKTTPPSQARGWFSKITTLTTTTLTVAVAERSVHALLFFSICSLYTKKFNFKRDRNGACEEDKGTGTLSHRIKKSSQRRRGFCRRLIDYEID